ncbi:MAG: hypothetical protein IKS13_04110 [Ruminococcus sp.]|nr:hypothetical protein [Ruminococcus sp.]
MKLKKTAPFILALTMCTSVPVIYANAAEKTQNDVKLVVSTDKKVYDGNDDIIAEVRLENNSDSDIIDVSIDSIIPEGYHLSDDSKSVLRSTYVMSGDSINSELVLISDNKKTNETTTTAVTTVSSTTKNGSTTVTTSKSTSAENTETSTTSIKADKDDSDDDKDSGSKVAVAAVIGAVLLAAGGAVVIFKKKGKGKNLMILLCLIAAGSFCTVQDAKADEPDVYTFSVTKAVNVADKKIDITANVKFSIDKADMQSAVEEYYSDNSEEIVSVEAAAETSKVYSEKEAIKLLAERGFSDFPLTYDYDMNGTYMDEKEASAESDEKHPMYQTYFVSEDGSIWTVFIVGKSIIANPASYNLESDIDAQVLVSETNTLTSYTEMGNKFYETVPKESAVILKVVDQITSKKLNDLNYEEVINQ